MQITITGPRAGGATTLAIMIGEFLKSKGMRVIQAPKKLGTEVPTKLRSAVITIVSGLEAEDEHSVNRTLEGLR